MSRQRWKPATTGDVLDVTGRLRQADIDECIAMHGVTPDQLFAARGHTKGIDVIFNSEGLNVALAGVGKTQCPWVGQIWFVATPDLENHSMEFLKNSKSYIDSKHKDYDVLFNWVHAANEVHLKWLRWCGFQFLDYKEQWGVAKEPFYEFIKVR